MLIIVNGQTSTGKTTLARKLAKDLAVKPFLKDEYKEQTYDKLGRIPNFVQWQRIENASWNTMYDTVQLALKNNDSLIIEANFMTPQRRKLRKIIPPGTNVIEVYCYAPPKTVVRRYINRNSSGERHKGHRDKLWIPSVWVESQATKIGWRLVKPLRLSEKLLEVDTSDFKHLNYDAILGFIVDASAARI